MSGVIGVMVGLGIGVVISAITYLNGYEDGWKEYRRDVFMAMNCMTDEDIVKLVRQMPRKMMEEEQRGTQE